MEYNKLVCDMVPGDQVEGCYILKTAQPRTTVSGKPFLNAALADRTGAIEAKVWDYPGPLGQSDEGKVVKVKGSVSEYRGMVQFTVDKIALARPEERGDLSRLVAVAPWMPTLSTVRSWAWWRSWRTGTTGRCVWPCWSGTVRPCGPSRRPRASTTASCPGC